MAMEGLVDVLRAYPWKCIECKTCEVCMERGDDVSLPIPQYLIPPLNVYK